MEKIDINISFMQKNISNISIDELIMFHKIDKTFKEIIPVKPNFRLFHLAFLIDYPIIETSKLIKKIYGHSFSIVVNLYRVDYLEKLMQSEITENKKIKITHLLKKSGFKSRNTYYTTLKRIKEIEGTQKIHT